MQGDCGGSGRTVLHLSSHTRTNVCLIPQKPNLSLSNLPTQSPALWIVIGVVSCIFWKCLNASLLPPSPPDPCRPIPPNESPPNTSNTASQLPEKIPEALLQQTENGEMKPLPSRVLTRKYVQYVEANAYSTPSTQFEVHCSIVI